MPLSVLTSESAPSGIVGARWATLSRSLRGIAFAAWGLAVIYFVNGLTSPSAVAQVAIGDGARSNATGSAGNGWIENVSSTADFHFEEAFGIATRSGLRLSHVAILGTVGALAFAAHIMVRSFTTNGAEAVLRSESGWALLGGSAFSAAFLVPFAAWAQGAVLLEAAGRPAGLEPIYHANWGWAAFALLVYAMRGIARRISAR